MSPEISATRQTPPSSPTTTGYHPQATNTSSQSAMQRVRQAQAEQQRAAQKTAAAQTSAQTAQDNLRTAQAEERRAAERVDSAQTEYRKSTQAQRTQATGKSINVLA